MINVEHVSRIAATSDLIDFPGRRGDPLYINIRIQCLQISKAGSGRKGYWIDGTIHSREWIATATVLKILEHVGILLTLHEAYCHYYYYRPSLAALETNTYGQTVAHHR